MERQTEVERFFNVVNNQNRCEEVRKLLVDDKYAVGNDRLLSGLCHLKHWFPFPILREKKKENQKLKICSGR